MSNEVKEIVLSNRDIEDLIEGIHATLNFFNTMYMAILEDNYEKLKSIPPKDRSTPELLSAKLDDLSVKSVKDIHRVQEKGFRKALCYIFKSVWNRSSKYSDDVLMLTWASADLQLRLRKRSKLKNTLDKSSASFVSPISLNIESKSMIRRDTGERFNLNDIECSILRLLEEANGGRVCIADASKHKDNEALMDLDRVYKVVREELKPKLAKFFESKRGSKGGYRLLPIRASEISPEGI